MFQIRNLIFRKTKAWLLHTCRDGVHTKPGPVFELRIYEMKPESIKSFLELMEKYWHVRSAAHKSLGFWTSEIGGISEVVHMWEYDSLNHRAVQRKKLAEDSTWQKEFLPEFLPKANRMNNALLSLSPGISLQTDFKPSNTAIYELHVSETPLVAFGGHPEETLVGKFSGVYGSTGSEYLLLRYLDANVAYTRALQRRQEFGVKGYSRLMVPAAWSPLK